MLRVKEVRSRRTHAIGPCMKVLYAAFATLTSSFTGVRRMLGSPENSATSSHQVVAGRGRRYGTGRHKSACHRRIHSTLFAMLHSTLTSHRTNFSRGCR